ncbi:WxL domain-containing protein [Enterococcus faecalis]|uniref:WxL domain-containing protein n=1 Tax=Enterococcus faecalis TaxID=1351 RepID=UPI001026C811|nr:WxL domain-containing protein [Enterococcus faecalis]EGO8062890.1 WxL domain-containing protein [Enterococcus faecalis]EGO8717006.1 WxL domain-containing protein [Enterococcus faecalis]EHA7757812.1 WxL domain-containing protein [Enterococcus faecalis]EKQ3638050.1 WxL domain-containing protein [Enterococcus faecalis]MDV7777434.1 WxL domain-containing protein [Enterococcus faecalis]
MKKKIMGSLLVGSAVVGASLAPLSAQAVTTGNTPVQAVVESGALPDVGGDGNTVRPDPSATNNNFDLLFIPREYDFGTLSISDDLTKPIPNKKDEDITQSVGQVESIGVGDLRGTKEGWHVTAQSNGLTSGSSTIQGDLATYNNVVYAIRYDESSSSYTSREADSDPTIMPETINNKSWRLPLGGEAVLVANAIKGKGQGLWKVSMITTSLNITTPAYDIKAGAYTGEITWNLVAGPSI